MRTPKAIPRGSTQSLGLDTWFLSFGDLLTLLVCFFLVLTPKAVVSTSSAKGNQRVSADVAQMTELGTDLASLYLDRSGVALRMMPVWRESLDSTGDSSADGSKQSSWLLAIRAGLEKGERAVVRLCDNTMEENVVSRVVSGVGSTEGFMRRVQFEVGAECGPFKARLDSPSKLAAIVTFSRS